MANKKKYYWLRLQKDFFKQKAVKKLRKLTAGGATYTLIYLKMMLLSLDDAGKLYFEGIEDNFIEELALELDESEEDVQMTVMFLQKHGLLLVGEEPDEYSLPEAEKNIGSESASAERVRNYRERKAALQCNTNVITCNNGETTRNKNVKKSNETSKNEKNKKSESIDNTNVSSSALQCNTDVISGNIEIDRYIEIDKEIDKEIEDRAGTLINHLSKLSFPEKIDLLKKAIMVATGSDANQVSMVMRPGLYNNIIDDLLLAIKKSSYLQGKCENKPVLNNFTLKSQIDRILAGAYEDFKKSVKKKVAATPSEYDTTDTDKLLEELGL